MAQDSNRTNRPTRIKDIKLNSLLEVTKAINNNFTTADLLLKFEDILKNELSIGKVALFSNDLGWKCIMKYGVGNEYVNLNVERDLIHITEISTIDLSAQLHETSFEIIIPVFHKSQPLAYVLIGDIEDKLEVSPAIKHLPFIQTLTNIIVVAIENKKLAKENIRQAAVKKELELASEMQSMLFPSSLPNDKQLEVAAFYLPHQQVGGDYYDFIRLSEDEIAFCMADVSGKGVSAALLMANFQANLRALINYSSSLTELIRELNKKVMANANGEKFITLFIAKYNLVTRTLNYVNAAHNPPVITNGKSCSLLTIGCTGLGMFDDLRKIKEGIVTLEPGSVIHCYTDGLVEIENTDKEEFGTDRLNDLVFDNAGNSMTSLNNKIIDSVLDFKGDMPYIDDIALFSCRFK
ncbi:MAG: PP2C family protein-serine/threonine phosphatase [Bacteroidetes bacterium]|nr:PP2C family protein-serine/threonine phosphatase [Bacteroidota bacterium]